MSEKPQSDAYQLVLSVAQEASRLYDYGDTLTINWVLEKAGITIPNSGFKDINKAWLKAARFLSLFYDQMLKVFKKKVRGIGNWQLQIVKPADQVEFAGIQLDKRMKSTSRRYQNDCFYVDTKRLTQQKKQERVEALARAAAIEAFIGRGYDVERESPAPNGGGKEGPFYDKKTANFLGESP